MVKKLSFAGFKNNIVSQNTFFGHKNRRTKDRYNEETS